MRRIAATILLTLLALAPQEAAAAGCYSTNYQKAEELFRQGSYSAAIKRYRAAKACPDKPKSNNIDARISECNRRLNPPKPTYYLNVDGRSSVSASFSSSGGSQWFSVGTNASSWSTWGVPSWCSVSRSSSGFTLTCGANTSTSPRSDYMKIQAGGKEVRIDISQSGAENYLTVNNKTSESASFSSSGGSEWFSIETNASSWSTWGVPSWCSVSRSSSGFTLTCEANNSETRRSDYMKIQAGGKEVRIDISQAGNPNARYAEIESVWVDHNQWQSGQKGMLIHVKFSVNNMLNRNGGCAAYFYWDDDDGDSLKDTNNRYCDEGGNVSCGENFKPRYKNSEYSDFKLFMPYNEFHITSSGKHNLKFYVRLWDKGSDEWLCTKSEWTYITYTR